MTRNKTPIEDGDDALVGLAAPHTDGGAVGLAQWLVAATASLSRPVQRRWRRPPRGRACPRWARARSTFATVASAVVLALGVWTAADIGSPGSAPSAPPQSPPIREADRSPIVIGTAPGCGPHAGEAVALVGPRPFQARSGGQAIVLFEAAYYQSRDGSAARQLVAADAAVADAAGIQAGIDSIPAMTRFCVRIQRLQPGLYDVQIHEDRPAEADIVWRQRIATSDGDGHTVITAITAV